MWSYTDVPASSDIWSTQSVCWWSSSRSFLSILSWWLVSRAYHHFFAWCTQNISGCFHIVLLRRRRSLMLSSIRIDLLVLFSDHQGCTQDLNLLSGPDQYKNYIFFYLGGLLRSRGGGSTTIFIFYHVYTDIKT